MRTRCSTTQTAGYLRSFRCSKNAAAVAATDEIARVLQRINSRSNFSYDGQINNKVDIYVNDFYYLDYIIIWIIIWIFLDFNCAVSYADEETHYPSHQTLNVF